MICITPLRFVLSVICGAAVAIALFFVTERLRESVAKRANSTSGNYGTNVLPTVKLDIPMPPVKPSRGARPTRNRSDMKSDLQSICIEHAFGDSRAAIERFIGKWSKEDA